MIALTCRPSSSLEQGQRTFVGWQQVNVDRAREQHADYCRLLRDCGASVRVLDDDRRYPDGVFLEDTAIVLDELAIVTSMGTETRRGEPERMEPILREYREVVAISRPASIEGGDVLVSGRTLLVGISPRTDNAGARALESIVRPIGYEVVFVPVHGCLHLKTACCALPDGRLLLNSTWLDTESLKRFPRLEVPVGEPWGANFLLLNQRIGMPAEHARTAELLEAEGFSVLTVPLSEFAKVEGGPTCLSLLISD